MSTMFTMSLNRQGIWILIYNNSLSTTIMQGNVQGEVDRAKSGWTASRNGRGNVLQRHRHWHMIESSGGNWSDVQHHSASTTTLGQETDDDDNDIIITVICLDVTEYLKKQNVLNMDEM
jgi:hypothetical protein